MARKYVMKKRLDKAYENYEKRYDAMEESLAKRGYKMLDEKLTRREYEMVRATQIDNGVTTNINRTIVSNQAYEYSQETARRFKATAKKYNLDWKDKSITDLRQGAIDVSDINAKLKEEHPDWTGKDRQKYISQEVFGSD